MTTVLCYGDSNTYGYVPETGMRYPRDVRYPGRLQMLLGDEYEIIEEGCNGRTTIHDDPFDGWKNGLDYLRPCLHSHKPIDIVILMLGSNDLKLTFHLSAKEIADGAGVLVDVISSFSKEDQGFAPKIILVSPPEIGTGIRYSPFYGAFDEGSIEISRQFPQYYRAVAEKYGCTFFDAAQHIYPSDVDSLHLTPEGHRVLAEKLCEVVKGMEMDNIHGEIDYSEYWERCWKEENSEELSGYLQGWNGHADEEMDIFRQYGVRKVCDAACGFGAHTIAFASNGFEVSAFDISERAVELTRYGLKKFGYEGVDVKVAGITDTGYDDEAFDAATAYAVMDHLTLEDAKKALAELMRIVKPDGLLLISFDAAEEEDFQCEHEELSDGSMIYTDASREGMLYRPYDAEKIGALVEGCSVVKQWTNRKGAQIVLLQKKL